MVFFVVVFLAIFPMIAWFLIFNSLIRDLIIVYFDIFHLSV